MTTLTDFFVFDPTLRRIREEGHCKDADDPDVFFPNKRHEGKQVIKRYCLPCPVRAECAEWALERQEAGVWGALTEAERMRLRKGSQ